MKVFGKIQFPQGTTFRNDFNGDVESFFTSPHLSMLLEGKKGIRIQRDTLLDEEEYRITIGETGPAVIEATVARGAAYGVMELERMRQADGSLPVGTWQDGPDVPVRAVHVTLSAMNMTYDLMKGMIEDMSNWRMNQLILEYDDHFPWKRHPDLVHPNTWSREQLEALIKFAEDHDIEMVPLLDSLGHAHEILKHEKYKYLAENPNCDSDYCPQNPKVLEFIEDLWDEILTMHKNARFAHITGDEVFRAKFCPKCQAKWDEGKMPEVYSNYYRKLSRFILSRGKRPLMWDDMLLKYPETIPGMPRDIIFTCWNYLPYEGERWNISTMIHVLPNRLDELKDYYAEDLDYHDGTCRAHAGLCHLRKLGFQLMGASASSLTHRTMLPAYKYAFTNQRTVATGQKKYNGQGAIMTFWSGLAFILGARPVILAAAEYFWSPDEKRDEEIIDAFEHEYLGLPEGAPSPLRTIEAMDQYAFTGSTPKPAYKEFLPVKNHAEWMTFAKLNFEYFELDGDLLHLSDARLLNGAYDSRKILSLKEEANVALPHAFPAEFVQFPMLKGDFKRGNRTFTVDPEHLLSVSTPEGKAHTVKAGLKATAIELLDFTAYAYTNQTCMTVRFHYADGSSADVPLLGNMDLPDWYNGRNASAHAALFLDTYQDHTSDPVSMFLTRVENPKPELVIDTIEMIPSGLKDCCVVIAAIAAICDKTPTAAVTDAQKKTMKEKLDKILADLDAFMSVHCRAGEYNNAIKIMRDRAEQHLNALV